MQNSLDRVFAGLQETLRDVVAPSVRDPYLRGQVTSVVEVLANLATRVEWSCGQLLEVSLRARAVLECAAAVTGSGPPTGELLAAPAPSVQWSNEALLASRDAHLAALREVQRTSQNPPDPDLETALRAFLTWQIEHEATLLRTGTQREHDRRVPS